MTYSDPTPVARTYNGQNHHQQNHRPSRRYRVTRVLIGTLWRTLFAGGHLRLEGMENVAADGPLLIVVNHPSNLDPSLFSLFPATVFFMAKQELFVNRLLGWWLTGCNCFPVDRGRLDRRALRTALAILARGGRLVVFVEGTLSTEAGMRRARAGIGFLVRHSHAPVLPCAITGTDAPLTRDGWRARRRPVTLRCGRPIDGTELVGHDLETMSDIVGAAIARMLPAPRQGYYANSGP